MKLLAKHKSSIGPNLMNLVERAKHTESKVVFLDIVDDQDRRLIIDLKKELADYCKSKQNDEITLEKFKNFEDWIEIIYRSVLRYFPNEVH